MRGLGSARGRQPAAAGQHSGFLRFVHPAQPTRLFHSSAAGFPPKLITSGAKSDLPELHFMKLFSFSQEKPHCPHTDRWIVCQVSNSTMSTVSSTTAPPQRRSPSEALGGLSCIPGAQRSLGQTDGIINLQYNITSIFLFIYCCSAPLCSNESKPDPCRGNGLAEYQ